MVSLLSRLSRRFGRVRRHHEGSREVAGIPGRVHGHDLMLYDDSPQRVADYVRAGLSGLTNIETGVAAAGRQLPDFESVLDFGCGHGRVLRHLARRLPPSRITAADVDAEAVQFCADEFGVRPMVAAVEPDDLQLDTYDLIWAGSVVTHLGPADCGNLIRVLTASLRPGGLLTVSFHGQQSLNHLHVWYGEEFAEDADAIRREVAGAGIAFRPYGDRELPPGTEPGRYGTAWHDPGYLTALAGRDPKIGTLLYLPHGWDNHHDVLVLQREG